MTTQVFNLLKVGILFLLLLCYQNSVEAIQVNDLTVKTVPIKSHNKKEDLGWHHYWDEEKQKVVKKDILPSTPPSTAPTKSIKPFTTEWFKENFVLIQQKAIDSPTKQNMRALLYAERVMADKSEVFARRKQFVQSVDPLLQEGTRIPMMGAAKNALMIYKSEQKEEALLEMQKHVGLALFYDGSCHFCQKMIPVINLLKIQSGLNIRVFVKNVPGLYIPKLNSDIPVYPDNGYSDQFKINFWPAMVMLKPPEDVFVISQGSLSINELTTRMVNVAFDQNILNEEWFYRVYPEQKGLISPEQLGELPADFTRDPVELINHVIDLLENPKGNYINNGEEK